MFENPLEYNEEKQGELRTRLVRLAAQQGILCSACGKSIFEVSQEERDFGITYNVTEKTPDDEYVVELEGINCCEDGNSIKSEERKG